MLKQSKNPYGYRSLLVYKKAEELQAVCSELTGRFATTKTLAALADQMNRSARSTKQNIVEGWKRNSTREYYEFLGFAVASNAELEEDCNDIWKAIYPDLMGIKGVMGERGDERGGRGDEGGGRGDGRGEKGERGEMGERGKGGDDVAPSTPLSPSTPSSPPPPSSPSSHSSLLPPFVSHFPPLAIERLRFYPLDPQLPPVVQLKLRAKELNFLLDRLQGSLAEKMSNEGTLSAADKLKRAKQKQRELDAWYETMLVQHGLVRLGDGRVVKKEVAPSILTMKGKR